MGKILEGVNLVCNPVISTLGPLGRTVLISRSIVADYNVNALPVDCTKDGYKVAMSVQSNDPEISVGVRLIQEIATKQMIDCGDATTTVCLLTKALLEGALRLQESGISHVEIKKEINDAVAYVVKELKKMSTQIDGNAELIRQVATVSANGDEEIGRLISEAFSQIGDDGVIDLEQSKNVETKINISFGLKFHKGWSSQYFVTNRAKAECVLENPYILIYDKIINKLEDKEGGTGIMPLLTKVLQQNQLTGAKRPLMIFSNEVDGEALATLTYNTQQGALQSCVVEMAFLGDKKKVFMEDIAAATGGTFVNELKGVKLENVGLSFLGQADKIIVMQNETIIIGGKKDETDFNRLFQDIKAQVENEADDDAKNLLKKRLARLTGSVATLSIGGVTEVEMKERYDRADDAVRATASSVESGYVVAGGTAFLRVGKTGSDIIDAILETPLKQICENASVDLEKIKADVLNYKNNYGYGTDEKGVIIANGSNMGYNARANKVEDLVNTGIIEPTKNNICALQNAASLVCSIISSKFLISDTL